MLKNMDNRRGDKRADSSDIEGDKRKRKRSRQAFFTQEKDKNRIDSSSKDNNSTGRKLFIDMTAPYPEIEKKKLSHFRLITRDIDCIIDV